MENPPFFLMVKNHILTTTINRVFNHVVTLWYTNSLLLKIAIEIVDLPINSMVVFHSFLYV